MTTEERLRELRGFYEDMKEKCPEGYLGEWFPDEVDDALALLGLVEAQHEALTEASVVRCGDLVTDPDCPWCRATDRALALYNDFGGAK